MSEWPHRGAFPHQHGDARGLVERIEAQLREGLKVKLDRSETAADLLRRRLG